MVSLPQIKTYLRIDYEEDDNFLMELAIASDGIIGNMVTNWKDLKEIKDLQPRINLLYLAVIKDLYDERGKTQANELKDNKIINSLITSLDILGGALNEHDQ